MEPRGERARRPGELYESRLVERFRQGDTHALSILFERHVDSVYAYARHILGSREDAEEVVSEAFLRAFHRAADYRGDVSLPGVGLRHRAQPLS